jgi:hypothetical protein
LTPSTTSDGGAPINVFLCSNNHRFVTVGRVYYGELSPLSGIHVGMREAGTDQVHVFRCTCGNRTKKRAPPTKTVTLAAEAAYLIGGWDALILTLARTWPVVAPKRWRPMIFGSTARKLPEWTPEDMNRFGFYILRGNW